MGGTFCQPTESKSNKIVQKSTTENFLKQVLGSVRLQKLSATARK